MDQTLQDEIVESCAARSAFYRFLSSIYLWELTQEQIDTFAACEFPQDDTEIGHGYAVIKEYLRHRDSGTRQELAVDYAHTFLGAGSYNKLLAPPYESVFTSEQRLLMQEARDGALAFYRQEHFALPAENRTPEDHLGFELQFMALLIDRFTEALTAGDSDETQRLLTQQQLFFEQHLANWLPTFCAAIDKNARTDFYRGVACLTRGLLETERETLVDLQSIFAD